MIAARLGRVILRELDLEDFDFRGTTTADEVPGWDSLSHVRIITAVEAEYGIRFTTAEVLRLRNLGDLQALVERKAR